MVILLTCTQLGGEIVVKFGEITKSGAKCGNAYFRGCNFAVWNGDGALAMPELEGKPPAFVIFTKFLVL